MKAWNYIKNDFDQEMGQEYSTIVHILVKADHGKVIAWRSVGCKMTCSHIPDEKKTFHSQSAFCTHSAVCSLHFVSGLHSVHSAVCSLHFVLTGIPGDSTVYFWLQLLAQHTQSTPKYLSLKLKLILHFCSFPC